MYVKLTIKAAITTAVDNCMKYMFCCFVLEKLRLDISCELSAPEKKK